MANLTLSIDDELLSRGRSYARAHGTSLNSLVRKLLVDAVSTPDASVDSMIERLRQSSGDSKGVKFNREELHRYWTMARRDFRVFDIVQVTPGIIEEGVDCSILNTISFWGGLIVASASAAKCVELISEDLADGQVSEGLSVRNPFRWRKP